MSKEATKSFLKFSTFAAAASLSLSLTSAVLRYPLSRGLVSLLLGLGLVAVVVYGITKYLALLWRVSDSASDYLLGRVSRLTSPSAAEPVEQVR